MKATQDFSFDGKVYKKGDAVEIADKDVADKLRQRKQVTEGDGKEPKPNLGTNTEGAQSMSGQLSPEARKLVSPKKASSK